MQKNDNLYSLKEFCSNLSISVATGKNWIKLKKISPSCIVNNQPFFSGQYIEKFKKNILSPNNNFLKQRRNKKYISGANIYCDYISLESENYYKIENIVNIISENMTLATHLNLILAECAIQLLVQKFGIKTCQNSNLLKLYLQKKISLGKYNTLIDELIKNSDNIEQTINSAPSLFQIEYKYEHNTDILGFLYLSCRNLGNRKARGAYFTPTKIVKTLIAKLFNQDNSYQNKRLLEPCCGTGNFLIHLPQDFPLENIFAFDIDKISIFLTRINLVLKYGDCNLEKLYNQIRVGDFLENNMTDFDYIIGNPPWGVDLSEQKRNIYKKKFQSAIGNNLEIYDLFVEHSLQKLNNNGILAFVLPEAILNVKNHKPVREIILQNSKINYINYLGNVFDKVLCPSVILQLTKCKCFSTLNTRIVADNMDFIIKKERTINSDCFNFKLTDEYYEILEKLLSNNKDYTYLKNNATFALGIVTGNNKMYLSTHKNNTNEIILKGSDIYKYKQQPSDNYITFTPEEFQQTAPVEVYRAKEKLLYRFICNQLVFAYDNSQTLTLNSCNILIPKFPNLHIKYILAILNSGIAQYIYTNKFQSFKVLRSHLENIPIPVINSNTQNEIIEIVDKILECDNPETIPEKYNILDKKIALIYGLTPKEYNFILNSQKYKPLLFNKSYKKKRR